MKGIKFALVKELNILKDEQGTCCHDLNSYHRLYRSLKATFNIIGVIQVDLLSHCSDALCMRVICIAMKGDHFDVRPYTVPCFFVTNSTSFQVF